MQEDSTTGLNNILGDVTPDDVDEYIDKYIAPTKNTNTLTEYLISRKISTGTLYQNCSEYLSKSYVYDIVNNKKKNPSRDVVLILCIAAGLDRKLTRRTLENFGHRDLYSKDKRDVIIAAYINAANYNLGEINEKLKSTGLSPLTGKE